MEWAAAWVGGRREPRHSDLRVAQKDSMAALSWQLALRLMLWVMWQRESRWRNSALVYWQPRSLWWMSSPRDAPARWWRARSRAASGSPVWRVAWVLQPRMRRLKASISAAR